MSSGNDPNHSEAIQAAASHVGSTATQAMPPAQPSSIPLSPLPKRAPMTLEQLRAWTTPLDWVLAGTVVALAFLVASFTARNNELMLHLATGRALLDGSYKFGEDPFSYTTSGVRWVNHSWLWDGLTYLVFKYLGGPVLIVLKALLVAVLAGFMLAVRRRGQSLWIPAVCVLVATLALGQRLLLQPVIISYLFLGITLYLLQKPAPLEKSVSKRRGSAPGSRRHLWLLVPLFVLWVNLDQWFFLGPLTVALWWIGELIQDWFAPVKEGSDQRAAGDNRALALVLFVGVFACLINPHHIYAFTLPAVLSEDGAGGLLQNDYYFASMFWGAIDYYKSPAGWSVVGVAFLVLLGLGLLSFAVNLANWRGWRITVWGFFAALAIYHVRAVPFFAVVGGSIAALNFQDAVTHFLGATPRMSANWRQWAIAGRVLTLVGAAILLLLAWPGWLVATVTRGEIAGRNVAWLVEMDPGLEKAAKQIQEWHTEGVLGPNDHGVNLSPDVAFALAWFAPDEKGFLDNRLAIFVKAGADYEEANKALILDRERETAETFAGRFQRLAQVLRKNDANHLIFHFIDFVRDSDRYGRLFAFFEADPKKQFTLVYRDGRAAIFSWDDPEKKGPPCRLTQVRFSEDKLAFGPQSVAALTDRPPAPEALAFYERIVHPRQTRPLATDEAAMHLQVFDSTSYKLRQAGVRDWLSSEVAALIGSGALAPIAGEPYYRAVVTEKSVGQFVTGKLANRQSPIMDQVAAGILQARYEAVPLPVSTPLLAVRACRRALMENPNDATTWYLLESAYTTLAKATKEREFTNRLLLLQSIRQVQRAVALNHAILIDPDHLGAHLELAAIFEQMSVPGQGGYYDLALHHRNEQLRIIKERGRMAREKPEEFERRVQQLQDHVDKLDDFVRNAQTEYYNGEISRNTVKAKAELALAKGLGGQARDDMVKSLEVSVEPEAIPLQLNLMVMTGAIEGEKGLRVGLDSFKEQGEESGKKPNMGRFGQEQFTVPVYEWLQVLTAAASGDYRVADEFLEPIVAFRQQIRDDFVRNRVRSDGMYILAAGLLDTQVTPMTLWRSLERDYRYEQLKLIAAAPAQVADIYTIRGILALEAGDNPRAAEMFRKVVSLKDAGLIPIAKYYLDLLEANGN
jgi:hypothetical protein